MRKFAVLAFLALCVCVVSSKTPDDWKGRHIYQVITDRFAMPDGGDTHCDDLSKYCGGTWKGLTQNLDYLKGMGFDAIWISPVLLNTKDSYHGYSTLSLYKLNDVFGTEAEFQTLIDECHKRDIYVMVDIVPNHMAPVMFDYVTLDPFNKAEHFHDYCYIMDNDYAHNQWRVTNCRLLNLPDLNHENPFVVTKLIEYIKDFISKWNIDGLRLDATPHMPYWFLDEFQKAVGMYMIGEIFDARVDYVASYTKKIDAALNFPLYFKIGSSIGQSGPMTDLVDLIQTEQATFDNVDVLGNFIDNHDTTRFSTVTPDTWRLKNALVMSFFNRGIPVLYYGTEQQETGDKDPNNRQPLWQYGYKTDSVMYLYISKLITYRKKVSIWTQTMEYLQATKNVLSFKRGDTYFFVMNIKTAVDYTVSGVKVTADEKYCSIDDQTKCFTIGAAETSFKVQIPAGGEPMIYEKQ